MALYELLASRLQDQDSSLTHMHACLNRRAMSGSLNHPGLLLLILCACIELYVHLVEYQDMQPKVKFILHFRKNGLNHILVDHTVPHIIHTLKPYSLSIQYLCMYPAIHIVQNHKIKVYITYQTIRTMFLCNGARYIDMWII